MPTGIPIHRAGISRKLAPGQPGTKRYQRQFGDALVCVRYRIHPAPNDNADETLVALAIAYGETDLRQRVKQAGGKWDQDRKVWLLPYGIACKLGLHGRIRKGGDGHA